MDKVSSGQKFSTALKVETWNAFVDAAQYVKNKRLDSGVEEENLADDTILIRNDSGYTIPQYGVMWIQSALPSATNSWEILIAKRPTCPFISQVGIASEPIANGELGHVWTRGQHPALLNLSESAEINRPFFATTQEDSFTLIVRDGSWGIPVIEFSGEGAWIVSLPVTLPPMIRLRLTDEQAASINSFSNFCSVAFLSFPESEMSPVEYYGVAVE